MKISNRLLISNVIITLVCMVTLSFILSNFMTNFIKEEAKDDLWTEVKVYTSILKHRDLLIIEGQKMYFNPLLERKRTDKDIVDIIIIDNQENVLTATLPHFVNEYLDDTLIESLKLLPQKKLGIIEIDNRVYYGLSYKSDDLINGEYPYTFVSLVLMDEVKKSVLSMRLILLIATIIISGLSVILTTYYDKKLTKPVKILMDATKRISEKKFDEKVVIASGDEFERLGDAINHMSERLKELDVEQKHFYENVSHDIKTPLAVISGYAQNIQSGAVKDQDTVLETIVFECDRLKQILENVIYLSKLDSVEDTMIIEEYDITEVVGESLDGLQSLFVLNEIDVIYEPSGSIVIPIDKSKMLKVFNNIFSNCLRFTKSHITIIVEENDDHCLILIRDNGPGFDQSVIDNPINRNRRSISGNGIGLSIVDTIITKHQGILTLKNNQGAEYKIELIRRPLR